MIKHLICATLCAMSFVSLAEQSQAQMFPRVRAFLGLDAQNCGAAASGCSASVSSNCSASLAADCSSSVSVASPCSTGTVVTYSPVVVSEVSTVTATASIAASRTDFRRALLSAAEDAEREGTITRAQLLKLRVVSLIPSVRQNLQQAVAEQAVLENQAVSIQAIDWSGLANFLKEIMPLILQLVDLFS